MDVFPKLYTIFSQLELLVKFCKLFFFLQNLAWFFKTLVESGIQSQKFIGKSSVYKLNFIIIIFFKKETNI